MKFSVLTLFPDQVAGFLKQSIIGRAIEAGHISLETVNIRDFAVNEYGKVDDTMYGGGTGMLMQCDPVYDAWKSIEGKPHTIYVSPKGRTLDQGIVKELAGYDHICIICGHYEGIDARVIEEICDEELSIGDYVLTGGEVASCVIIDSVSRMIPGVLPNEEAYSKESHMDGTLEAPQYTKPSVWHDKEVPEILLSGNKAAIDEYNHINALYETMTKRPDMFDRLRLSEDDIKKVLALHRAM